MADSRGRYRDVLRVHDFRLLVIAFFVDQVGSWAYNVVLIVWVFDRTHSPTWIAFTTAAGWVPRLLFYPYAGVLADRFERTTVMLTSALLSFLAMAGLTLVVAQDGPPAAALGVAVVAGACMTGYRPAAGAILPEVVSERDLVAANAIFGALESLVIVMGPGMGGLLLLTGRPAVGITLNALSFLASALIVTRLKVRSHGGAGRLGEGLFRQLADGASALRRQPSVLVLVIFCYLDSAVYGAATVVYVPLSERLGTGSTGYSYLLAGSSLGGVLLAAFANRWAGARRLAPIILGGMVLLAGPFAVTATVHNPGVAFVLQVASGGGMIIVDILAITAIQRDLPGEVLSRVLGLFEAGVPGSLLLSSFICAAILRAFGLTDALLAIGFGFSAATVLGLLPLIRTDRRSMATARVLAPRVALVQALDLFAGASRTALERLAAAAHEVAAATGDVLIHEGDKADALWVLVSGQVAVSARGEAGHARRLRTMGPGSYFGEIGLLRRLPRTATVRTLEPCELLRIDAADFFDAVQGAGLSSSLLATSASRLARSHPRLSTAAPDAVSVIRG